MKTSRRRSFSTPLAGAAVVVLSLSSCAPQRPYRTPPIPPNAAPPSQPPASPAPAPAPPPSAEIIRKPLPAESTIREQVLKSRPAPPSFPDAGRAEGEPPAQAVEPPPPLPDDSSLLAKITPGTSPQRAASLRLTDEASKLLDAGEPAKALARLERTIVIDSTNAYGYFYLAKAHYLLGRYQQSLDFLSVAESRLSAQPFWLAEVHALRGENYRAQGQFQRAESSYQQALRLNSGNRTATHALSRLQLEASPATR